ncbi:dimethylamine monooxygenase subunit DmmA family protein [Marinobacterium rhizophilum]|uniref:dimethylamine monooxygenase subunit DmmA family protein n=1 Tax=Marinobacterium rhizophilum TaxID=420402 RepID=UPI00036DE0D1|nr:dimethylamine monooxygenase subunit DmmA family protein [Marinobacterium rhizophilum]
MQAPPAIKSRPVYAPVCLQRQAQFHLFICEADGLDILRPLVREASCLSSALLVFGRSPAANIETGRFCDPEQASAEVAATLLQAPLASAIYVAGREAFLWQVRNQAREVGFADEQIRLCSPVNRLRRVFCTHCYELTDDVGHTPVTCAGCKRPLLVRDHFSRFLGAYVGVQINAEDPTEEHATEELC